MQKFFLSDIYILTIRACFEFRASNFEFIYLPIYFTQNDINAANGRNHISDQASLNHFGKGAEIEERWGSNPHSQWLIRSVADEVVSQLSLGSLHAHIDLSFWRLEAFGDDFELSD